MKLSEIKPDVLYATCDGVMVKAVEPISAKWYSVPVRDEDGNFKYDGNGRNVTAFEVLGEKPKEDPWATCSTGRSSRRGGVHSGPGTLVEAFHFDEDGKPTKSQGKMLVRARDIGGGWDDYLLLHSETVREVAENNAARAALPQQSAALHKAVIKTGFNFPVGEVKRREDRNFYSRPDSSTVSVDVVMTSSYERSKMAEGPPVPLSIPRVGIGAKNDEDVKYLLEVLRLGVIHKRSLEKRRAREAADRASAAQPRPRKTATV